MAHAKTVSNHSHSKSIASVPKTQPQKTTLAPKQPNAVPTHGSRGGF